MADSEPTPHVGPMVEELLQAPRRPRSEALDWDGNRQTLYRLYIQEDRTLIETMRIMKQTHQFDASAKLFKEKFKFWRWQKNLPGNVAHWMVDRANLREASGRKTEFVFGGQTWTVEQAIKSTRRTKKDAQELVDTPVGMVVATPASDRNHASPTELMDQDDDNGPKSPSVIVISAEAAQSKRMLPLSFNGKSRNDLAMELSAARAYSRSGEAELAQRSYVEAFNGYEHLLSATHEDTLKIGYEFATFYVEQDRKADADEVLEDMTQKNIDILGIDHRTVKQHILHVAELLNSWNRGDDAMVFLNHAWDIAKSQQRNDNTSKAGGKRARGVMQKPTSNVSAKKRLQELDGHITRNPGVDSINHGLQEARVYAAVEEPAVEVLLLAIEQQCLKSPSRLAVQGLRTRAELLKYYLKQDTTVEHLNMFSTAIRLLDIYWRNTPWDGDAFKSHEIMEASLELASAVLRGNFNQDSNRIFREIDQKATSLFGSYDERTIWICISTGIIYQRYRTWSEARPWFEQANAAADAAWGGQDGVTRSLEKALEKHYFSYVSDEGRPFKTVFGVCGSVIDILMKDHCVIAMDTRGHGRSTMDATPFTYELYASDAAGLLRKKNISKAAWVGWSDMGIGTLAALMSSANSSLIDRALVYGASQNPEATNATFSSTAIYQEFITGAIAEYNRLQPTGNITALAEAVGIFESKLPQWTETSFDGIALGDKVAVAHGEHEEAVVLTEPALLHSWIKGSKLVVVTNVSHFAPVQDPAQFAAKVQQFLAK